MPLLILIAEDDPSIRLSVKDYLEDRGYSAIAAENGNSALLMLEKFHPHLLISDIKMPGINGYELVKKIRQLPKFRLLPVIFLTEHNSVNERVKGYEAGCDIYLPKPFELVELGAVIRNLLERSQMIHSELRFSQEEEREKPQLDNNDGNSSNNLPEFCEHLELTQREREVLILLMDGHSNPEIGNQLHLSPRTIEKYVSSLLRKTGRNNRVELIRYALQGNLV
ncbi:DNA-binding response regulator [Myxosarcina sp. GI1]|uniref:response regulator transcription factor n=1 Tax=Myxosarcina sp. GI1 TaxID=1541065 RepID=UPI000567232D|nr:DNA-binding response regulator [Myxosarcina sp. GI1]